MEFEDLETWESEILELETWESVMAEKEEWIRLIHHLEGLTLLSNAVGQGNMRKLPPAPCTRTQLEEGVEGEGKEEMEDQIVREKRRLNVGELKVVLLSDGKLLSVYLQAMLLTQVAEQ